MTEINELQKKRAINIIWNAAGRYDFTPDFKAFTPDGNADLYFNLVIGAVRKKYDYPQLEKFLRSLQGAERSDEMEGLIWLGLENAVFPTVCEERPVAAQLRIDYAEDYLRRFPAFDDYRIYDSAAHAHWVRAAGGIPHINGYDISLLDELEFPSDCSTEEVVTRAKKFLEKWFFYTGQPVKRRLFGIRRRGVTKKIEGRYRNFFGGFADHPNNIYLGEDALSQEEDLAFTTKLTEAELREFIRFKYGAPTLTDSENAVLERNICTGNHCDCHLHFTRGEPYEGEINNAFEALQKQKEKAQIIRNREYYRANLPANRTAINKLASSICNSVLMYLQASDVKANSGSLRAGQVWRATKLNDGKIFSKRERDDTGDISVDILLDASVSQKNRQETVSSQGYIIAEALNKCHIPCRVMSFCSMTGYTIVKTFRSYYETMGNDRIFDYVSNGCNRDGLAIRTVAELVRESPCEHRLLIILSDVKPNDVVRIRKDNGVFENYALAEAVKDTAAEVRRAKAAGISVICVFTGTDEDLPSARTVYGNDFTRITSVDMLADTVGKLILNTIQNI